jgi:hypothetical protein
MTHGLLRRTRLALPAIALAAAALAAVPAVAHGPGGHGAAPDADFRAAAAIRIRPLAPGGPRGVAFLRQRGTRLTGWIAVWGLAPGTVHANHLHGPNARCTPASRRTMNHVAEPPDLRADAQGVAFRAIDMTVHTVAVTRGVYWMVHENPSPSAKERTTHATMTNPPLACGNIVPLG